jgi:transposase
MWTRVMIVLGADTHKRSHTLAAINVATGQVVGDKTAQVGPRGFATLLGWARGLDGQRVWALEDCRATAYWRRSPPFPRPHTK